MKRLLLSLAAVGLLALAMLMVMRRPPAVQAAPTPAGTPVVVELFTSEGCSDCPPADDVLADLTRRQPVAGARVIALGEHVDYWNRLGWADPFSQHAFSERQAAYAPFFHNTQVYTPQMVVDGSTEFLGSDRGAAVRAIAQAVRAPKADITVTRTASTADAVTLHVRVTNLPTVPPGDRALVFLAVTEDGLRSDVRRGENAGRRLNHAGVVRRLVVLGRVPPEGTWAGTPAVPLAPNWSRTGLQAVVFVQEDAGRRVLGAAALPLD